MCQRKRKCLALADGATSPRQAAAATAAAAAATAATASPAAASATPPAAPTATATSAAPSGNLFAGPSCAGILLVENKERAEADVGDLFFTESESGSRCGILGWSIRNRPGGRRRCAARQRQRHANDSQRR